MLHLASTSRPEWIHEAVAHTDLLLIDHAHCEKKAASTAINLIFRYPNFLELVETMSALAREELEHFELVLGLLKERGIAYDRLQPSAYAGELMKACRKAEPGRLVDTLLLCSLIEARSCERMKILGEHHPDEALAEVYQSLLASEARHHHVYVDLALQKAPRDEVFARLHELAAHEAQVIATGEADLRMHS